MRIKKLLMIFPVIICLAACGSTPKTEISSEVMESTDAIEVQNGRSVEELKEIYPEFFALEGEPFKGIEVYVWQMAKDCYYCGLMFGTNRNKTDEEIWGLQEKALTVEEAKFILDKTGIEKSDIFVLPIAQPYSSYLYEINDEYREKVTKLFE